MCVAFKRRQTGRAVKCTLSQLVRKLHESSGCCPAAYQILEADALARTCGGGAGTTGDHEVAQDIRGLVSRSGKGPAALTRWNRGTGEQSNQSANTSVRAFVLGSKTMDGKRSS